MYSRWRVSHLYLTQLSVSYLVSSGMTSAFRNPIWMSTNNLKLKSVCLVPVNTNTVLTCNSTEISTRFNVSQFDNLL